MTIGTITGNNAEIDTLLLQYMIQTHKATHEQKKKKESSLMWYRENNWIYFSLKCKLLHVVQLRLELKLSLYKNVERKTQKKALF